MVNEPRKFCDEQTVETGGVSQATGIFQLVYRSRSKVFSRPEDMTEAIRAILNVSRAANARYGITGALLFNGKHFAQALEGPVEHVTALMHRIELDIRHTEVTVVKEGWVTGRDFGGWAMAYVDEASGIAIRLSPMVASDRMPDTPHREMVLDLLQHFVRNAALAD